MDNDLNQVDSNVAVLDKIEPQPVSRQRGHDLDARQVISIGAIVAAGAAIVLTVLTAGSAASAAACDQAMRTHISGVLAWKADPEAPRPGACKGMSDAEVDQISGRIYGQAFNG
jgi:hypothetical protein